MRTSQVIDADTHVFEPLEHFDRYLEEPFKHRSPRVFRDQWGIIRVLMEGRLYPDPSITVYEAHEKLHGHGHNHDHGHDHDHSHDHGHSHAEHGGHSRAAEQHHEGHAHGHSHEGQEESKEGGLLEGVAMAMGRPGVTNPEARLEDLETEGIDVQVILGSLCFAGCTLRDPGFALA